MKYRLYCCIWNQWVDRIDDGVNLIDDRFNTHTVSENPRSFIDLATKMNTWSLHQGNHLFTVVPDSLKMEAR